MPRAAVFKLTYLGTDITNEINPLTLQIAYTDNLEGEADDLAIALLNSDLRWLDTWLPAEGDRVALELGYEGEARLGPVQFEVDEPEWSGMPDGFKLQAQAVPLTSSLRERRSQAYENTTLRAIASRIAEKHGLELVGEIPNIRFKRLSQSEQTDLEFLRETAAEYGLLFKIEGTTRLVFFQESDLEAAAPVLTVKRTEMANYRLRRSASGTYKAATVSYQNAESGEFIEVTIDLNGAEVPKPKDGQEGAIASESILRIRERVESRAQARLKAVAALKRANSARVELDFEAEGNVLFAAGSCFTLEGFKRLDGKYLLSRVRHQLDKGRGYRCSVEARKVEG
ncbi:contractile injection system protein, VgrG/Pvc8 family [Pseudanabaena sp. FACHB-2040]|uniref:phage late control D family protein n=1 Tax=Pseudanabaena sp. FACHB-2040 TaxID=2692859 RepID=UPI001683E66A|nr:contractile injection system protein, VgrG/Pvc8 family [Pseudanabaena sp. FACHB-2040]MBD2261387.1 hypothetical protein [Pseudanabaena sp. FACHB-2040]